MLLPRSAAMIPTAAVLLVASLPTAARAVRPSLRLDAAGPQRGGGAGAAAGAAGVHAWALEQLGDPEFWVTQAQQRLSTPPHSPARFGSNGTTSFAQLEGFKTSSCEKKSPKSPGKKLWEEFGAVACRRTGTSRFGYFEKSYAQCPAGRQCFAYQLFGGSKLPVPQPCSSGDAVSTMTSPFDDKDGCKEGACVWFRVKDCVQEGNVACKCLDAKEYLDQKQEELDELSAQMVATVVVSENLPGFTAQGGGVSFQDDVRSLTKDFEANQAQLQAAKLSIARLSTQNAKVCKTADLAKCQEWTSDGPSDPYVAKCTIHEDHGKERPFCHCKPSTTCFVNCVSEECTPPHLADRGRVASPKQPIKIPCHEAMHPVRTLDPSGGEGGNSTASAVAFKLGTCGKSKYGHESCECLSPSIAKSLLMEGSMVAGSKVVDKCDSVRAVLGLGSKGSEHSICMSLGEIVGCMPAAGAMQSIGTLVSKGASAVGDATGSLGLKYVGNEVASLVDSVLTIGGSVLRTVDRGLGALAAPLDGRYWDAGLVRGLSRQGLGAAVEAKLESEEYLQGLLRKILTAFVLQPFMPGSLYRLTNATKGLMARHTTGDLDASGEEALAAAIQQLRHLTSDLSAAAALMQEPLLLASGAVEAPQPGTFCTSSSNKQFEYLKKEVKWERLESFLSYGLALSAKQVGFMVDPMTGEAGAPVWAGPVYSIGDTDLVLSLKLEMIMGLEELVVHSSNCEGDLLNKGMYCDLALVPGIKPLVARGLNAKIICKKQNCLDTTSDVWNPEEATSFLDNEALILLPSAQSGKQRFRFIPGKATLPARQKLLQSEFRNNGAVDAALRQKLEEAAALEKQLLDAMARRRINPGEYEIEELGLCGVDEEGEAHCEEAEPNVPITSPSFGKPQHQQARILDSFNRKYGTDDAPGEYVVTRPATATSGAAPGGGAAVGEPIEPGTVVSVAEVVTEGKRVRGRISNPAGWISLEDTDCVEEPCRWAEKVVSAARVIEAFAAVPGGYGKITMKLRQTHRWMGQYTIKGRDMKSRMRRKDGDWLLDCDDALVATLAEQGVEITPGSYPVLQMIYVPTAGVRLAQVLSLDEDLLKDIGEAQHAYLLDLGDTCMCDGGEILKSQVGSSGAKWFERLGGWLGHGAEEKESSAEDEPEECKKTVLDQELDIEFKNIIVRARVWFRRTYSIAHASDLHPSKSAVTWAHKRISQKAKKFKWWLQEAVSSSTEKSASNFDLLQRRAQEMLQRSWVKGVQMNRVTVWEDQALSPTLRVLGAVALGRCVHRLERESSGCALRSSPTWCNMGGCEWRTATDNGASLAPERVVALALPGSKVVRLRSTLTTLYATTKGCECAVGRAHKYSGDLSQGFCRKHSAGDESAWCATVGSCGITGRLTSWGHWSKCDESKPNGMSPVFDVVSTSSGVGLEVGDYVTDDVVGLLAQRAAASGAGSKGEGEEAPLALRYVSSSAAGSGEAREARLEGLVEGQTEVALSLHFWSAGASSNASALHEVSASREVHSVLLKAGWAELTAAGAGLGASEEDADSLAAAGQNLEYRIAEIDGAGDVAAGLERLKAGQAVDFSMPEADVARAHVVNVENEVDRIGAGKPTLLNFKLSGESCLRREVARDVECTWFVGKCMPDPQRGATKQQCGMIDLHPERKGGETPVYHEDTCKEASLRAGGPGYCVWKLEWNRKCLKVGVSDLKLEPLNNDFIAVRPVTEKKEGRCSLDAVNSVVGSTIGLLQRFKAVEWLAGKLLVDPVVSVAYSEGPWGGPDSLRWLEESAADGALVCAGCQSGTRGEGGGAGAGSAGAAAGEGASVLDVEICKSDDSQGTHRRFRMDINPREVEITRSVLSMGISELRQGELWRGMLGKATNSTRLIMDLATWWAAPASELARLKKEEAAREKGLLEQLIFRGLGQEKAQRVLGLALSASGLSQLEGLGDQPYLIKAVKLRGPSGAKALAWPSTSVEHRATVPVKQLLSGLKRSALGDLRVELGAELPTASSGKVPAGAALTAVRRADRMGVIWGDAGGEDGSFQDDVEALAKLIKSKGLQDSDSVEATFSSTPSLEEWLASTPGAPDQKLSLVLVGGCECAAGWSGKSCHLQLPSQANQMVVDEVDVEGLITLASRGTGQNCVVQEAGGHVVCNSHLAAELMRHGKCTDMVSALKSGEEGILKGVFKLERPTTPDQCPAGNCAVVCSGVGGDCLGELAYIRLLSTGRYCRVKAKHSLACDLEEQPWRCTSSAAAAAGGASAAEACAKLESKQACTAEPACIVEPMPFVLRGNLDAFKDQAFWKDTFKVVLGGAGAAALVFVGAFFPPVGAATYLLLLGALGGAGAYGGMKVGGSVDAKLGGGAQGLLWSIGRQMKGVRKWLYNILDYSLESLYEIDERSFGGLGDLVAR